MSSSDSVGIVEAIRPSSNSKVEVRNDDAMLDGGLLMKLMIE